jgi:hypothetical protein
MSVPTDGNRIRPNFIRDNDQRFRHPADSNQTRRPSVAFAGRLDQRHGQAALGSLRQKRDRFLAKPFGLHVSHQRRIGCSRAGHGDKGQSRAQGKGQIGCPLGRDTCRGRAIDAAEDMGDPSAHDSQA